MTVRASDCVGVWRRTLLVEADGSRDTGTDVTWLQGVTAFVDSRGFAGTLHDEDGIFEWRRTIDLTPTAEPDVGEMRWEEGTLVETGVHADYVEHWVRDDAASGPCWAMFLTGPDGGPGLLLRMGTRFGFAGAGAVVVGEVGGREWEGIDAAAHTVRANGALWTIDKREGVTQP
ncbi:hypothetical protein PDG61_26895 [Mycolicibacterium sp. BiH015]|uniref:hypothetical protein n=1 Tax=Mycolicibacterium sp. BiH015 TaxID=3018808 RepID=UPI0022E6185F|nr:hypothetical protein [Mycolicibacterium sp. BiH015]MDA2894565.1 hypothetical protein [Mycolicibacterium sp. BiH015]